MPVTPKELRKYIDVNRVQRRLDELSDIGATSDGGVTRPAYSEAENEAFEYLLEELPNGYVVEEDSIGNVFATPDPDAERSIFTGSHLDTVFNGGYLDGALGVVASLEAITAVYESNAELAYPPTLAVFRAEESARFGHHTIGSREAIGMLDVNTFSAVDQNDIPLWRAMQKVGFQPENLSEPSIDLDRVAAFLEIHIEQGRVLEESGDDLGVVSSIRAPVRYEFTVTGDYDHSGATPMELRQDALTAASKMIVSIEEKASNAAEAGDIVGTVGTVTAVDGSINQVCGEVTFQLDLRSADIDYRDNVESTILEEVERIADSQEVTVERTLIDRTEPVTLDDDVVSALESGAQRVETDYQVMPSGGGHDAMNFQLAGIPTGMLFVPSVDGVSHNPNEKTTEKAIEDATRTLARTLIEYE